jgi:hypothetical protein
LCSCRQRVLQGGFVADIERNGLLSQLGANNQENMEMTYAAHTEHKKET